MKGSDFPEATTKLAPPEGMEESVYALPVWVTPESGVFISKWEMTWRERIRCLIKGHVWLHIIGPSHPPVAIETDYPFRKEDE